MDEVTPRRPPGRRPWAARIALLVFLVLPVSWMALAPVHDPHGDQSMYWLFVLLCASMFLTLFVASAPER